MTGTPVKDVGMFFDSLAVQVKTGTKNVAQGSFQKIWDNGSGKKSLDDTAGKSQHTVKKTPGDSLKAKEEHMLRTKETQPNEKSSGVPEEWNEEQFEDAMAVLETAAMELVQQIADTFGVSEQEIQSTMEELGMEVTDVLHSGKLGELFLKVSGAEDSYALVTNEELFDNYKALMEQLQGVIKEAGEELNLEEGQLKGLLERIQEQPEITSADETMPEVWPEGSKQDTGRDVRNMDEVQTVAENETVMPEEKTAPEADSGSNGGERGHSADKGETANLFLQNLKSQQFQPEVQQTMQSTSPWDADTQNIMRQIMDYMKLQVKPDVSDVEMQLHPQSLGTLQIHVASKGGVLTANFVTQNETVKAALESQMVQLQESFEEQGIKVNAIEVTVQTHEFERNQEQGRGDGRNQEPTRKSRVRRINLNDLTISEEMEQEDALAADMMAAGGNTVDYTA